MTEYLCSSMIDNKYNSYRTVNLINGMTDSCFQNKGFFFVACRF